jgi:hydrogenase-4 component F
MNAVGAVIGVPALAALVLAAIPHHRASAAINVAASALTLLAGLSLLVDRPPPTDWVFVDDFNVYMVVLTAFVGATTSLFSAGYIGHELAALRLDAQRLRFYHAMYQGLMCGMLLALVANNLGVMWLAVEGAALIAALMIGLYRTPAAIEAAWKYFIFCAAGSALALFGAILMYLAAQPVIGPGMAAMAWLELARHAARFDPALLNLAFVFALVGYGAKAGLAPMHGWVSNAHAEGPTPVSAVLSGLLLNVALYAVLRFKMLLDANGAAIAPGPLMMGLGLASLLLASLMLYGRRDAKRLFAYSSVGHMGIIAFAFGLGGPLANFAGLLHMATHSLAKSAVFFAIGHAAQVSGTQKIAGIRALTATHPALGWGLVLGVVALAGLPPMGVFISQFVLVTTAMARSFYLALPLVLGLALGFGAMMLRLQGMAFGPAPAGQPAPLQGLLAPLYAHLALVVAAGVYLPPPLVAWLQDVARMLN